MTSPARLLNVAVFGSSEPAAGHPLYEQARRLGRLLAAAGHPVVTGGYGGVMEGASRGAVEAGGRAIGVTCEIFAGRPPNPYLTRVHESADLHERTRILIDLCSAFVVLRGKAGTLAELAFLWALQRAGCLDRRPVILLDGPWRDFLNDLVRAELLEDAQLALTRVVDSPEQALASLKSLLPAEET